jgi:SOS-response transcriptional repressor LexA
MPATVIPISARRGEYVVVRLALPNEPQHAQPQHAVGVLLLDPASDRLFVRMRSHWSDLAGPEDQEFLAALEEDFRVHAANIGAARFLASLEDSLSHILRIDDRESLAVHSFHHALEKLFAAHVERPEILPFRTHLPLYSLRAAATRFGEDMQVEEEEWVPVPPGVRAAENLFVAHVVGRSMEPRIPDGSLNIFRTPVVGSRQGKILLVELLGELNDSARYTIKRYSSKKRYRPTAEDVDAEWEHESIRLEPLNPEFEAFELDPSGIRVVAEWVGILD